MKGEITMAMHDWKHDGKKDWQDNLIAIILIVEYNRRQ